MLSAKQAAASSKFRWLATVDASFERMLKSIETARSSIRLEMYIYTASPIGVEFQDALVQACKRGVQVKVLIDAWGSMTLSDHFWNPLREAGGEFRWFNPISFARCGFRDHRKLLVCDEQIGFVGGFNIASEYQGDGVTRGWHDFGIEVHGVLAHKLAESFDALFAMTDFEHKPFARFRKAPLRHVLSTEDGQLLLSGPGRGRNFLKQAIMTDLAASRRVQLISAYFLPTRPIRRALCAAARRGTKVQLILAGKSDVPISQLAVRPFYLTFLRAGIELYEYTPQILHGKLFVFDHSVYAGSANLDRRSLYINYELMLRITKREVVSEASAMFEADLARCQRIDPESWKYSRTLWNRLKESWAFFVLARLDPLIARWQLKNLR